MAALLWVSSHGVGYFDRNGADYDQDEGKNGESIF